VAKRRGQKPKLLPMKVGNDPALWRFASLQEALETNTDLLAQLVRSGQEQAQAAQQGQEPGEAMPVSESA
jgi:hypothetical protein